MDSPQDCPHSIAVATVQSFLLCGDLAIGFTRLQCPDCDHERLLALTWKGRHFCPSCHQRRVRSTSEWIATAVCHEGGTSGMRSRGPRSMVPNVGPNPLSPLSDPLNGALKLLASKAKSDTAL